MGAEMIKDSQGKVHLALSDEDFYNDDIMGDKLEDYDFLEIHPKDGGFFAKVRSKSNSKTYAMKKIDSYLMKQASVQEIAKEFEQLKQMDNLNITKYYKYFLQDQCLYILYEYVNNNDLNQYVESYKSLKKQIEVNTMWNFFMQCISALSYIQSQNIIHKNIKNQNIFMTENKTIKLGDFRFSFLANQKEMNLKKYQSPEMNKNLHFDKKTDIYAMGVVFHYLCYFGYPIKGQIKKNENKYPSEMDRIIELMLKNENERPDIKDLYNLIMAEYIKNVAKITSIDSVFRCMYSFSNFYQNMKMREQSLSNQEVTPISFNYIKCMNNYKSGNNPIENTPFLNNVRNLLYKNDQINNEKEINPSLILDFLLEKLNIETSDYHSSGSFGIQPTYYDLDKTKSLSLFDEYFNKNFNSVISQFFVGKIKTKRICQKEKPNNNICRMGYYSFHLFPYIEFDLDRCNNDLNLQNWFKTQNNINLTLNEDHKIICNSCQCFTKFFEFKQFYTMPHNFIISLNRGEGFKNNSNINIPMLLDLTGNIDNYKSFIKFNLVGIVKRITNDLDSEYYIALYLDTFQKCWFISENNNVTKIDNPLEHNKGLTMILFYSAAGNIGL